MKKLIASLVFVVAFSFTTFGQDEILTRAEALKVEAKLKQNPTDYIMRMRLIWFYQFKESAADKAALQRLRLDCARFIPDHDPTLISCLGTWEPEDVKKPEYLALKNEWLKQVGLHKVEKQVLLNAFSFFADPEPEIADKILNDAKNNEPFDPEFTDVQIKSYKQNYSFYENLIGIEDEEVILPKINSVLKRIVASANDGVARIEKKKEEADEDVFFRKSFIAEGAAASFDLDDLKTAGDMSEMLLNSLRKEDESIYGREDVSFLQIGMSIKGRIELRRGNLEKAREYMINTFKHIAEDADFDVGFDSIFLSEMLVVDGRRTVLDYLAAFEKFKSDDEYWTEYLTKLRKDLARGTIPDFVNAPLKLY